MTFYELASNHPFLVVILAAIVGDTLVGIAKALRGLK